MNKMLDEMEVEAAQRTSATVLVIDDERRSLESLRRVLSIEFEVLCAASAQEAAEILAGDLVQVILCDQRMPEQTGVDFLKRVRDRWPEPVRIIISGYTDAEDIIAGVNEAGIFQYITKPWDPEQLVDSVRAAAELYRLQKEGAVSAAGRSQAVEIAAAKPCRRAKTKRTQALRVRPHRAWAGQQPCARPSGSRGAPRATMSPC